MRKHGVHLLGWIAVTVLVTAGAAQGLSGSNTVDSGDIKDGQVTTADLAANAVTSTRIKNGEVKSSDVASNAVTGAKVADGSLKAQDIDLSSLLYLSAGTTGSIAGNAHNHVEAACDTGDVAVGGTFAQAGSLLNVNESKQKATDTSRWDVWASNTSGVAFDLTVRALCLNASH